MYALEMQKMTPDFFVRWQANSGWQVVMAEITLL